MNPLEAAAEKYADNESDKFDTPMPLRLWNYNYDAFLAGAAYERERAKGLVEAASRVGTQCLNTGMYGPLKIQPGKCECSSCDLKRALQKWRQHDSK